MKTFLLFLAFFFVSFSGKATVTASIEYPNVSEGQIVELRLSSDSAKRAEPDFSVLNENFHIMGTSTSSSYQIVNGQVNASFDIILNLLPKKSGVITIPEIEWENEKSNSVQVSVQPAGSTYKTQSQKEILITGKVLNEDVYESAALTYRAEVLSSVEMINYNFIPPKMENAEIIATGPVQIGQQVKNGTVYRTYIQDYAIFVQKAGDNQKIEGAVFQGLFFKRKNSRQSTLEPFIYGHLSTPQEEILLRADDLTVDVLSRPSVWNNKWWLPAKKVEIKETYTPSLENIKVGESITRTIEIQAFGVMGVQLPDIVIPASEDFKVYSEMPQKDTFYHQQEGVGGTLKQSFVFVPLKSGNLVLPSVKVNWFDTISKKDEIAVLSPKTIVVLNDAVKEEISDTTENVVVEPKPEEEKIQPLTKVQNKYAKENNFLYFIAGLSVGLALLVIALVIFIHPRKKKLPDLYLNK